MTRRFIISSIIFMSSVSVAQTTVPADSLLFFERAAYLEKNPQKAQQLLLKKANLYIGRAVINADLQREINRINPDLLESDKKQNFLWDAALISYMNAEYTSALSYFEKFQAANRDSSTSSLFLEALIIKFRDTTQLRNSIAVLSLRDKQFSDLDKFISLAVYEKKHKAFYMLSSAIVPGSGTIMLGDVFRGFNSLAVCSAAAYGIVSLAQAGLYINAVLWTYNIGLKFYTGNVRLTDRTFDRVEMRKKKQLAGKCELLVNDLLKKYPLTLRAL